MATKKTIPFDFIFEYLQPLQYTVKPMFGCFAIYIGEKLMLIVRDKKDHTDANGVWIATDHEHHQSLKKSFPSLTSVSILHNGNGETSWQMVPVCATDFESSVLEICTLIRRGDKRIGKVPKKKKKKEI